MTRKAYSGRTETGKSQPGDGKEKEGKTHSDCGCRSIQRHCARKKGFFRRQEGEAGLVEEMQNDEAGQSPGTVNLCAMVSSHKCCLNKQWRS
jgi:hypothetical protein